MVVFPGLWLVGEIHHLIAVRGGVSRPGWEAAAVRGTGLSKVRPVVHHDVADPAVTGTPAILRRGVEVPEYVLDLSGMIGTEVRSLRVLWCRCLIKQVAVNRLLACLDLRLKPCPGI